VTLQDHGLKRTLDRGLVATVQFNTDANSSGATSGGQSAPASGDGQGGNTVPAAQAPSDGSGGPGGAPMSGGGAMVPTAPTEEQSQFASGVSDYYQVPPDDISGFVQRGLPYEELPVVFYVASRAHVAPDLVVSMRLAGRPWADICAHFELGPGIFYWNDIYRANLGGPYAEPFLYFHRFPRHHWLWNTVALTDLDIINLVNLRFTVSYWHRTPYEVAHLRGLGNPFFHIWFGFGPRGGRYYGHGRRGGWGHGEHFHRDRGY
jgi:hypothetical protein